MIKHIITHVVAGFLIFISIGARAQSPAEARLGIGYGSFLMEDMHALQQSTIRYLDVNAKATEDFPAYYIFNLTYYFKSTKSIRYGVSAETGSTGGRVDYADYSGSYRADHLLRYHSVGVVVEKQLSLPKQFRLWLGVEASYLYTQQEAKEKIYLTDIGGTDEHKDYRAHGLAFQPQVSVERGLGRFRLGARAGYNMNINQAFRMKGEEDIKLEEPGNEGGAVAPGWSGWRIGLYSGIHFGSRK